MKYSFVEVTESKGIGVGVGTGTEHSRCGKGDQVREVQLVSPPVSNRFLCRIMAELHPHSLE